MKHVIISCILILAVCLISCTDNKQYLGEVTVYEVDIQGLSDKSVSEDGAEAILVDVLDKSARGETPYKVGEYSCRVYKDNDHYAIEYGDEVYVLSKLNEPQYGTYRGTRLEFHYSIDSYLKVEDLP